MATILEKGINIIINRKIGDTNKPIYPFTKTANVIDENGNSLKELIADTLASKEYVDGKNYVPENQAADDLTYLRNDNTWHKIPDASVTQKGVVQLSSALDSESEEMAATAKAVKELKTAIDTVSATTGADYVKKTQLGVASTEDTVGVATLHATGQVPASQLPSYVDDVVEGYYVEGAFYKDEAHQEVITGESSKIYVDLTSENTYRWSGTIFVEISKSLALGETASTAFPGDKGKIAYDYSQAVHAMVDATKVTASDNNGYIKVTSQNEAGVATESEVLVYTHPQAEGFAATNPHGTTAADVGLGKVENKTGAEIRAELTSEEVANALGFTPTDTATKAATASQDGYMTKEYAAKLDNCSEISIGTEDPTFTSGSGIWFQVVSED